MKSLDEYLTEKGISDEKASQAIGLSRGYFSRVRNGVVHPSLDTALRIYDWAGGKIDIRSMVPPRVRNQRLVAPDLVKVRIPRRNAA
jgi:transcriptional regulator with XRE-family HTH domain